MTAEGIPPGEEPTTPVSVSGTISAVRSRVGMMAVSAYIEAAARQIERDNLDEIIAAAEAEHGPVTAEEIAAKRAELARTRRGHDSGAA